MTLLPVRRNPARRQVERRSIVDLYVLRRVLPFCAAIAAVAAFTAARGGGDFASERLDNWHQWRGPEGNGTAPRGDPPLRWDASTNVRWKVAVPGEGHASPIVWGDKVFVLAAVKTERVAGAPANPNPNQRTEPPLCYYRFLATAFERQSGKVLWEKTACEDPPHEGRHETNSYASASPMTDGERLYASFGSRGIFCYDLDGRLLWQQDLGDMQTRLGWGEGASPAVGYGTVIVNWDQEKGSFVVALDAATGKTRWKFDRDEPTSWATPLIVEHAGRRQAIINATNRVRSYDLDTGAVIWECGGQTVNAIPSPVSAHGLVVCMSGYRGSAAVAVSLDAKGDVTSGEHLRWSLSRNTPYVPSPLLYGDLVYFTKTNGAVLTSVDARTGKVHADGERLPDLTNLYASPVGAAGRVYFVDRDGTVLVIKHGPKLEVLATNRLGEPVDASPAVAGRQLFVRSRQHLFCLEEAKAAEKPAGAGGG